MNLPEKKRTFRIELILTFLSRASLIGSFYGLYWILEYVGWMGVGAKPPELFFVSTMFYWMLFLPCLFLSIVLEMAARHPEVRHYFTHIERGRKEKAVMSEEAALAALLKKYPSLARALEKVTEEQDATSAVKAELTAEQRDEEKVRKLPLI